MIPSAGGVLSLRLVLIPAVLLAVACELASGESPETVPGPDVFGPPAADTPQPHKQKQCPGLMDTRVPRADFEACVCDLNASCCSLPWDAVCTDFANDSACADPCDCKTDLVTCTYDGDCSVCDLDADLCTGGFRCAAGFCEPSPPVQCDTSKDVGCAVTTCDRYLGRCVHDSAVGACADGDTCTKDLCNLTTGACSNEPIAGCQLNSPCRPAATPGCNDPIVEACTCKTDTLCCVTMWEPSCIVEAKLSCGLVCDCATMPAAGLSCVHDDDCAFCDDGDACNGRWICVGGTCSETASIFCPPGPGGCVKSGCNPTTGACSSIPDHAQCKDADLCTFDQCTPTGTCTHAATAGCDPLTLSCAGRCGAAFDPTAACSCDAKCFDFSTCCEDACEQCAGALPGKCP